MAANPPQHWMPVEEYLELERNNPNTRYEYLDGEVLAMAGGTIDHGRIALNVAKWLDNRLQHPCHVHTSDIKVRLNASRYTYPDVHVSCLECLRTFLPGFLSPGNDQLQPLIEKTGRCSLRSSIEL